MHLTRVLERARRALAHLEEKAAGFGALHVPTDLQIELEEKRREVVELEQRLGIVNSFSENSTEDKWLKKVGLVRNPFRYWIAEWEDETVSILVQPKKLRDLERQIRGEDHSKQSWVIFANAGLGKTTLCQMVAYARYPLREHDRILSIIFDSNSLEAVLEYSGNSLETLDSIHYVRKMQDLVLRSTRNTQYYDVFDRFMSSSALQKSLTSNVNAHQELKALAEVISQQGFKYLLCLVDQVDEVGIVESEPAKISQLLRPLMSLSRKPTTGVTFRYFLPSSLKPVLTETKREIFRLDRYVVVDLEWNFDDLLSLIAQRLTVFSEDQLKPRTSLGQLCEPKGNFKTFIDQAIIRVAEGSPRAVIWLANRLIQLHCQEENLPLFIQPRTWEHVQAEWWDYGRNQLFGPTKLNQGYIKIGKYIYCGGKQVILSKKSEALLGCLIDAQGDICPKETLIRAGWPDDNPKGVTNKTLQEAIRRMKIELDQKGADSRWIATLRSRGYCLRKPEESITTTPDLELEGGQS